MLIRAFTIDDIAEIDRIRRATVPWHTARVSDQRHWFRITPERARAVHLCAEIGGRIVGFATASLEITAPEPDIASAVINTDPDFRGQGIARALYQRVEEHLRTIGARRLQIWALDEPTVLAWANRLGFEPGATERYQVVDPRSLPAMPPVPVGVTLVSAGEAGPEAVYHVDNSATQDEPGDIGYAGMSYDDWMLRYWNTTSHELSVVALVDGAPAAVTMLNVNPDARRVLSNGSCTLREYRGRGLMKLAKSVSLRRTAEAGITAAFTGNDVTNTPMLAVNTWLGYTFVATARSIGKAL